MIVVVGTVTARTDTFDRILAASLEHVRRSRTEPGCISHGVGVDCENPLRLAFFERWADRAALHEHFKVPATLDFVATLRQFAAGSTGPQTYEVAGPA